MQVYTDRSTAPLKFHKFLIWFALPLGILVSMSDALQYVSAGYQHDGYYYFDMGYYVLFIALMVMALIGLWRFHRCGPLLLYAGQVLAICYFFVGMLIFSSFGLPVSALSPSLARSFGRLIVFVFYYQKRMPLFTSKDSVSLSEPTAPQQTDPLSFVPPILYAEPENIPRKYSGTIYTLTGKTKNDLEVLQSLFEHSDSKVNSITARMDEIGNTPGNPERESLAHQFLAASYTGQCAAYMIAAIATKKSSLPRRELFPDLLRNVQFEWDYMCDLVKDLQLLQVELAALSDDSQRQTDIKAQISKLEDNISNSQLRIYRLYRM